MNSTKVMLQLHRERKKVILDKDVWLKNRWAQFWSQEFQKGVNFQMSGSQYRYFNVQKRKNRHNFTAKKDSKAGEWASEEFSKPPEPGTLN